MTGDASEVAAALRLIHDGGEICALVGQNVAAAAEREGRELRPTDYAAGIELMLSSAWQLAQLAYGDSDVAKKHYADLLRRFADSVEAHREG